MRIDRLVPAIAGLAAGFGVLLLSVDVADTALDDAAAPQPTVSAAPEPSGTSTAGPTASVIPTTPPTTAPVITQAPVTTTTLVPETTTTITTDPAELGEIVFDLRCIGVDLGRGSLITVPIDSPELRDLVRVWVVEQIISEFPSTDLDRFSVGQLIESFDLRRCAEMLLNLQESPVDGDGTGGFGSQRAAWLCAFADEIVESNSLSLWLADLVDCPNEPNDPMDNTDGEGGNDFDSTSPATPEAPRFPTTEGQP